MDMVHRVKRKRRRRRVRNWQPDLPLTRRGGRRPNAGGPRGADSGVSHLQRAELSATLSGSDHAQAARALAEHAAQACVSGGPGGVLCGAGSVRVSAQPVHGAVESPAPDRRGQRSHGAESWDAGAHDSYREGAQPQLGAQGQGVRRPVPRAHPAHTDGGAELDPLRAVQPRATRSLDHGARIRMRRRSAFSANVGVGSGPSRFPLRGRGRVGLPDRSYFFVSGAECTIHR